MKPNMVIISSKDLGNDWRPSRHIKKCGLFLYQWQRLQVIRKAKKRYLKQIAKWDKEAQDIVAAGLPNV